MVDGVLVACRGYRCLDRDVCYTYDELTKSTSRAHDSDCCDNVAADERATFQYRAKDGTLQDIRYVLVLDGLLEIAIVHAD